MESVMLKNLLFSTATLALLVVPATAANTATSTTTVNINVPEQVSVWGPASASLVLDGQNPQNSAATESSISYITNVNAAIKASVDTSGFPAPSPGSGGGGIQFYIFNNVNAAAALAAIALNQYSPAGALTWNEANSNAEQTLIASTGATGAPVNNHLITYGASLPGDISPPDNYSAVVTYTITATP